MSLPDRRANDEALLRISRPRLRLGCLQCMPNRGDKPVSPQHLRPILNRRLIVLEAVD